MVDQFQIPNFKFPISNSKPHYKIFAEQVELGINVEIEEGVIIKSITGPAKKVVIGDNVFIGQGTRILVPEITIGDYTRINGQTLIYGYKPTHIGYNCYIGEHTILNSTDDLSIGNNCCIAAYSQLWTHIKYGDVMEGCRYNSTKRLVVEDDVWFCAHCIVSPILAHKKSMALPGSVITKDLEENHIYGGCPAQDLTEKLGPPFKTVTLEEKKRYLQNRLEEFYRLYPEVPKDRIIIIYKYPHPEISDGKIYFNVSDRTYTKTRDPLEIKFMKFLLPLAKFVPRNDTTYETHF